MTHAKQKIRMFKVNIYTYKSDFTQNEYLHLLDVIECLVQKVME